MSAADTVRPGRGRGILLVLVSAASFGAMAIFARAAYDSGASVTGTLFLRFAIAGAVMAAAMTATRTPWPRGRDLRILAAMGALGYVGQSWCYFAALTHASAGLVALLLYLYPAIVTLLAVVLLGARLTRRKGVALALALAGAALTVGGGSGEPQGILLGAGAAVIYSVYIIAGSRVTAGTGALASSAVVILSAAFVYGMIVLVQRPAFPASAAGWAAAAAIAVVSTVVAIATFFAGLRRLGPADAATISTFEPVVTLVLAALLLGEPVGLQQAAGAAAILAAAVLIARSGRG